MFQVSSFPEGEPSVPYGAGKFQERKGFTLVEMLIVIFIILTLTSITVPIYQGSKKQLAIQRAVNKLAQDIRRVEGMAMGVKTFKGSFPSGGYGIYFNFLEPNRYTLFADSNSNEQYDGAGELVEDIFFETGVQISQLSPASPLRITFTPPDPTTKINSGTSTAVIVLKIDNSTTSVKVLPTGLIFIESP